MEELRMLTQEELAELLHSHVMHVSMLRELGVIPAIKTGRNYMFTQNDIRKFQNDYRGLDVSNKVKALESQRIVKARLAG
ncbi:helix-turn-helix domain-containing protein [Thomasclavelia spiroformis]|uniref:helix-turn-helix domain-containing protein n=1 Tax=Thomasclavelia spiroformis TaxID=29348 RepID=UPI00399397DC